MGWWIFKLAIIGILLIPGSIPLMVGYVVSVVYRIIDPNFIIFNLMRDSYHTTIGSLPMLLELLIIKLIVLIFVIPYLMVLRRKYPGSNWMEISKAEVGDKLQKLSKPEHPDTKSIGD